MITLGYYCIDYFWVLPLTQYFASKCIRSKLYKIFILKIYKFLCYFILLSCIYIMLLAQKKPRLSPKTINEAIRLFSGLADLDYEPGYNNHVYFQYLSNNKNDISLLRAYYPEEIYLKYIIRV